MMSDDNEATDSRETISSNEEASEEISNSHDSEEESEESSDDEEVEMDDVTWLECEDDEGNQYYYNVKTGESTWQLPEDVDVSEVTKYEPPSPGSPKSKLAMQIERARTLDNLFSNSTLAGIDEEKQNSVQEAEFSFEEVVQDEAENGSWNTSEYEISESEDSTGNFQDSKGYQIEELQNELGSLKNSYEAESKRSMTLEIQLSKLEDVTKAHEKEKEAMSQEMKGLQKEVQRLQSKLNDAKLELREERQAKRAELSREWKEQAQMQLDAELEQFKASFVAKFEQEKQETDKIRQEVENIVSQSKNENPKQLQKDWETEKEQMEQEKQEHIDRLRKTYEGEMINMEERLRDLFQKILKKLELGINCCIDALLLKSEHGGGAHTAITQMESLLKDIDAYGKLHHVADADNMMLETQKEMRSKLIALRESLEKEKSKANEMEKSFKVAQKQLESTMIEKDQNLLIRFKMDEELATAKKKAAEMELLLKMKAQEETNQAQQEERKLRSLTTQLERDLQKERSASLAASRILQTSIPMEKVAALATQIHEQRVLQRKMRNDCVRCFELVQNDIEDLKKQVRFAGQAFSSSETKQVVDDGLELIDLLDPRPVSPQQQQQQKYLQFDVQKRKVQLYCRVRPKPCNIVNSSIILGSNKCIELCNEKGRSKRWMLDGLVNAMDKNDTLFSTLRLEAFCFTDPINIPRYCAIFQGQKKAEYGISLLGHREDPGLLARCLYAISENIGYSMHTVGLQKQRISMANGCEVVYSKTDLTIRSLYSAQGLVLKLEKLGPGSQDTQPMHVFDEQFAKRVKRKKQSKKQRRDEEERVETEIREHFLYTIYIDGVPKLQFLLLYPSDRLWKYTSTWNDLAVATNDAEAVSGMCDASQAWLEHGIVPETTDDNPLLQNLYVLQSGCGVLQVVTHISQELQDANESASSLNRAQLYKTIQID